MAGTMSVMQQVMSTSAVEEQIKTAGAGATSRMAAAIISYNTREHLRNCLASLEGQACSEIVVVDNGSQDGSVEMVRAEYPSVRLHLSARNAGYGAASNIAMSRCTAPYVLLLNSDTLLGPGTVRALAAYLDRHPDVAVAGPRLLNADGTLQVSCYPFPSPLNELLRWTALGSLAARTPFLRERYLPTSSHRRARDVGWPVGAALAIRRNAFETVGGFDVRFFMYSEEVDLCFRLHKAGWRIHFAPVAEVVHLGGASTARYRAAMAAQLYASLAQFYRHHYSWLRNQLFKLILSYVMLRRLAPLAFRLRRLSAQDDNNDVREDFGIWKKVLLDIWRTRRGEAI